MKISEILNQIDLGSYALPEFQRGYVWNRDQVKKLMMSLYRGYPIGVGKADPERKMFLFNYLDVLNRLNNIKDTDLHISKTSQTGWLLMCMTKKRKTNYLKLPTGWKETA